MANRTIKLYKGYFNEFYVAQDDAVRRKINYCINVVKTVDRVPSTILKSNGFQKKTQKTPKQQIERAKKLMNEYFKEKENGKG